MIKQSYQLRLTQKLSPQQIIALKMLQIPTYSLEERIKEELEDNPALELGSDGDTTIEDQYELNEPNDSKDEETTDEEVELSDDNAEKIDLDDFLKHENDDGGGYDYGDDYSSYGDKEKQVIPASIEKGFHDNLLDQLGMLELEERSQKIAIQIIGSIDEEGYLRREVNSIADDLAFGQNLNADPEEINEMIKKIQTFDPPGVCAWTLQECLILQLKRMPHSPAVQNAILILEKHYEEFIKKHYDKIQFRLKLSMEDFKESIGAIIKLNPRPGSGYTVINKAENYVIPDFLIYNNNGILDLTLNSKNAPELRISEGYKEMMKAYERSDKKNRAKKEAIKFIKHKLEAAKWFIDAIKQRQHTLLYTMQAIMNFQHEFFLTGDESALKPMILKDIAQTTGLDVSTLSRVANSKFVQTEFGTFKLKYFFAESMHTESGEDVSTREIKTFLQGLVNSENKKKPLSDDELTELLLEKGYNIARRTVAKYREYLNIPVARLRREL